MRSKRIALIGMCAAAGARAADPELPFGKAAFGFYSGERLVAEGELPGYGHKCTEAKSQPASLEVGGNYLDFAARPQVEEGGIIIAATPRDYQAVQSPLTIIPPEGGVLRTYQAGGNGTALCSWVQASPSDDGSGEYDATVVRLGGQWADPAVACNPLTYAPGGPIERAFPDWKSEPFCSADGDTPARWTSVEQYHRGPLAASSPAATYDPSPQLPLGRVAFGYYFGEALVAEGELPGIGHKCTNPIAQPAALEVGGNYLDFQPRPQLSDVGSITVNATDRSYEVVQGPLYVLPPEGGIARLYVVGQTNIRCRWLKGFPTGDGGYNVTTVLLGGDWGTEEVACNPLSYAPNGPVGREASAAGVDWLRTPFCKSEEGGMPVHWSVVEHYRRPPPSPSATPVAQR